MSHCSFQLLSLIIISYLEDTVGIDVVVVVQPVTVLNWSLERFVNTMKQQGGLSLMEDKREDIIQVLEELYIKAVHYKTMENGILFNDYYGNEVLMDAPHYMRRSSRKKSIFREEGLLVLRFRVRVVKMGCRSNTIMKLG